MYASSLAEHNEATFVVFKVIEFAVITNYKHIAIATTCYHNTSLAGLQGIIVCPSTPYSGCSYKSNILAIGGEYRVIFTIGFVRASELEVVTWCRLLPSIFCTQRCLL